VVEKDIARAVLEINRAGSIDDGGLLVQNLVDAFGRGAARWPIMINMRAS